MKRIDRNTANGYPAVMWRPDHHDPAWRAGVYIFPVPIPEFTAIVPQWNKCRAGYAVDVEGHHPLASPAGTLAIHRERWFPRFEQALVDFGQMVMLFDAMTDNEYDALAWIAQGRML